MALGRKKEKETDSETPRAPKRTKKATLKKGKHGKQFVLLIGDEGAILVFMEGRKVVRRLFAPTPQPSSTEALVQLMQANASVPLSILVDNIDQQFVRQSFPPVSALSVGGLVKRRLERDFQAEDLKGYLPVGRDKTGRKEWHFLLIALAKTAMLRDWIDLIVEMPNELKGLYLVPVEATVYISTLHSAMGHTVEKPWQLMVTHNKVSGFRQVVTRDDKLVFTRVTQAIDDAIPAVIAGNIEQEIINTIEYLRRLGFQDNNGLDITVIASADVNEVLDLRRFQSATTHSYTPLEVSDALGMEQAALSADRFGDVVMACAFMLTKKRVLKFSTAYADSLSKLYKIKRFMKYGVMLIALLFIGLSTQNILGMIENQALVSTSKTKLNSAKSQLSELQEKVNGLNKNLAYKSAIVSTYDTYLKDTYQPNAFVKALAPLIGADQQLISIDWALKKEVKDTKGNSKSPKDAAPLVVRAEFEMKGTYADLDALEKAELAFIDSLAQAMPEFAVTHDTFPWQKDAEKVVEISFNQKQNAAIKEGSNRLIIVFTAKKGDKAKDDKALPEKGGAKVPPAGNKPGKGGAR